jgi:TonB family protein
MRLRLALAIFAIGMAHQALAEDGAPGPLRQWTGAISAAIHGRMNPQAVLGTRGGTAVIRFTVLQSGEVRDVSLARSSGVGQVDTAALAAVRGNLPAAPAGVTQQSLSVSMPLNYHLRQAAADPACQWSKSMRSDQSIKCPNDDAPPVHIKNVVSTYGYPAVIIDPKTDQPVKQQTDQPARAEQSGDDIDREFTACLRTRRDGTVSMLAPKTLIAAVGQLLGKCNDIANAWEASCRSHGSTENECGVKASLVAAAVLKETGQLPAR